MEPIQEARSRKNLYCSVLTETQQILVAGYYNVRSRRDSTLKNPVVIWIFFDHIQAAGWNDLHSGVDERGLYRAQSIDSNVKLLA